MTGTSRQSGGPSARPGDPSAAELAALVAALEGEQATLYAYGVVGARAGARFRAEAAAALRAHALQRDLLSARLSAVGRRPPPGEPAYALPFPVTSAAAARALAAHVETALAARYADLVAAAAPGRRREAAAWLTRAATAAQAWGAAHTAFPGLPERATS